MSLQSTSEHTAVCGPSATFCMLTMSTFINNLNSQHSSHREPSVQQSTEETMLK